MKAPVTFMRAVAIAAAGMVLANAALAGPANGTIVVLPSPNGDSTYAFGVQTSDKPWSIETPAAGALRFEVKAGDRWPNDAPGRERSEIAAAAIYPPGEDIAVSYDFTIEPGVASSAKWLVAGQFHANDRQTPPPFAVEMRGEKLAIAIRYRRPEDDAIQSQYIYTDPKDLERGRPYAMQIEARFSTADGALRVLRDGIEIVSYRGPLGYDNGVYWKQGVYRSSADEPIAATYRNLRFSPG